MSEEIHRQLVDFLGTEFAREANRACILLDLVSAQPGMRGEPIRTWDRKENPNTFEGQNAVETLATEIIRLAEEHAESYGGGVHRFEVRTTQHLGGKARSAFRIRVDGDEGQAGSGEDPPTATGLVGQLMRHNEANARLLVQLFQQTMGTMARTNAELADENRALRVDRRAQLAELENARSAELEREMKAAAQVAADDRKDKALAELYRLAPVIKARLLGAGQTETGETPEAILIQALAESLDPEQMAKIAAALKPNQTMVLGELLKRATKKPPATTDAAAKSG